ncbi:hypothetical protein AMAG_18707 [Allomyces macrogynus ATCC 38327]|uniref:Uncharacterized protein n=1 Tax=Allomyces macrogynus (strain ATCC 38327) TaxID=578462 RepID=A0A0L0SEE9_ALLM3|nr:hypothetical protein AMAG_18707 [Allomyces macrogynus ATCC 38327]|eukprot:KNE60908.1 hypothetical protein AMAG_18707 [Allomyces macrogynus ATCC 38327]
MARRKSTRWKTACASSCRTSAPATPLGSSRCSRAPSARSPSCARVDPSVSALTRTTFSTCSRKPPKGTFRPNSTSSARSRSSRPAARQHDPVGRNDLAPRIADEYDHRQRARAAQLGVSDPEGVRARRAHRAHRAVQESAAAQRRNSLAPCAMPKLGMRGTPPYCADAELAAAAGGLAGEMHPATARNAAASASPAATKHSSLGIVDLASAAAAAAVASVSGPSGASSPLAHVRRPRLPLNVVFKLVCRETLHAGQYFGHECLLASMERRRGTRIAAVDAAVGSPHSVVTCEPTEILRVSRRHYAQALDADGVGRDRGRGARGGRGDCGTRGWVWKGARPGTRSRTSIARRGSGFIGRGKSLRSSSGTRTWAARTSWRR